MWRQSIALMLMLCFGIPFGLVVALTSLSNTLTSPDMHAQTHRPAEVWEGRAERKWSSYRQDKDGERARWRGGGGNRQGGGWLGPSFCHFCFRFGLLPVELVYYKQRERGNTEPDFTSGPVQAFLSFPPSFSSPPPLTVYFWFPHPCSSSKPSFLLPVLLYSLYFYLCLPPLMSTFLSRLLAFKQGTGVVRNSSFLRTLIGYW